MQISSTAKIAPSTDWAPAQPAPKSTPAHVTTPAVSAATAVAVTPVQKPSSSAQVQNSASLMQVATLAATYSTTVAGKSYPGSVEESGGIYIASVPSPPGITATGPSVASAERNLNIKLDALA
jgi:hypothetical protein